MLLAAIIVAAAIVAGALIVAVTLNTISRAERCNELRDLVNAGSVSMAEDLEEAEERGCDWTR